MLGLTAWTVLLVAVFLMPMVAALGAAVPASGAAPDTVVQQRTLPNGLTVLVQEDHSAPLVCTYIWYRVGLRNEPPGQAGITHFLEHMAFKGTERFSGRDMDRLITMRGGYMNGFTSMDYTGYVETLPADALDLAFSIESERMARCLLKADDIESEKGVVISEFEGAENDPSFLLRRDVMAKQFPGQPYGRTVIGVKDDLRKLTRDDVVKYYQQHYAPNNATLVVVGDIAPDEVFAKAEKSFGSIPGSTVAAPTPNPGRDATGEQRLKLELPGRTSYVHIVYGVPAIQHPDHVALEVLQNVLSGGRTSRLYRALVDSGIASDAGGWDYENPDPAAFAFEISLRPKVEHQKAEDVLDSVVEKLATEPVGERELTKAKNQTKAHFVYASDGVTKLGQQIGYYATIDSYGYLRTFPAKVDAVTAGDIQRVVRSYLKRDNRTAGWLIATGGEGPEGGGMVGGPSDVQRYRPDPPGPGEAAAPPPVPIPGGLGKVAPVRKMTLPNGMDVVFEENHAAPFVTIYGNIMSGPVFDPPGKSGLAAFTAEMLSHGTEKRTWSEIQDALEFVAAQLGFGNGTQVGTVGGQCLKDDLGLLLEAAAEQVMLPSFPSEEIEKVRSLIIAAQERRDEDTFQVAEKELFARLYPVGHPLHDNDLGTKETVGSIARDDLVAFHLKYYRPENTILAIVGDFDPDQAGALVEKSFGGWKRLGQPVRPDFPQVPPPAKPEVVRIPIANKTQLDISIGFPGISRRDPDFYQADLMNYLLGRGGFMSRLNLDIREKMGLAYYVFSAYYAYWGPGPWVLHMGVNPANADAALKAAIDEIEKMQAAPPADEEMNLWKDYVQGTVARQMETFGGIAQNLVLAAFYDLGLYYPYEYPRILRAITADQVQKAAKERLFPGNYTAVVVGPVDEIGKEEKTK